MEDYIFEYQGKKYTLDELHYQGTNEFKLGSDKVHTFMCNGQRGRGKNTVHLANSVDWFLINYLDYDDDKHKFHFLRRSEEQLNLVISKGIFTPSLAVDKYRKKFRGYEIEKVYDGKIYLTNPNEDKTIHVGYVNTLNNVKGVGVEDSDNLIFDEYVEPERRLYKGGSGGLREPDLFGRLDDTIFRGRKRWLCILGNEDSPTNPYNEYFSIPYKIKDYHDKQRKLYYHFDFSEAYKAYKETTSVGELWKGTTYGEYSTGEKALGELNNAIIAVKPPHATHDCNIDVGGTHLTVWYDIVTGCYYVHDNYKFDLSKPIYTVFSKDMTVNSLFVSYQSLFLMRMKRLFSLSLMRFNTQKSASLFSLVISLSK